MAEGIVTGMQRAENQVRGGLFCQEDEEWERTGRHVCQ